MPKYCMAQKPKAKIGVADNKESMRSKTPPCPGKIVPESLTPARRFSMDSNKSPNTDAKIVTKDSRTNKTSSIPVSCSLNKLMPMTTTSPVASPPISPSTLLFGETLGDIFRLPNLRPTKYAPLSAHHTNEKTYRSHQGDSCHK